VHGTNAIMTVLLVEQFRVFRMIIVPSFLTVKQTKLILDCLTLNMKAIWYFMTSAATHSTAQHPSYRTWILGNTPQTNLATRKNICFSWVFFWYLFKFLVMHITKVLVKFITAALP